MERVLVWQYQRFDEMVADSQRMETFVREGRAEYWRERLIVAHGGLVERKVYQI